MTIKEFRAKRITEEISAVTVAKKANVDRSRLSLIETGHRDPTEDEMRRLAAALNFLLEAKAVVRKAAIAAGWPELVA
jgi:transcriptional regulator with XRE-family HTH domain